MALMDWHKCNRWTDRKFACPYVGDDEHTDDDQDPEEHDWMEFIRRGATAVALGKALRAVLQVRKRRQGEVRGPGELPDPVPIRPPGLPRAAFKLLRGDEGFVRGWEQDLRRARAMSRVPARSGVRMPARSPVRGTSRSASRAAASERSLVRSLRKLPSTARPWDTGAYKSRAKAPTGNAGRASAVALSKSSAKTSNRNRRRAAAVAAAALTTAGAVYLSGRKPRGRGGMHAPAQKFRGASPKDFVFVR